MKHLQFVMSGLVSCILAACGNHTAKPDNTGQPDASCMNRTYSTIGGPISLVSHEGTRMTEADFTGRSTLVYFGFTYCPDICPGTLVALRKAFDMLPDGVQPPGTVLITIDPVRDTPQALHQYVNSPAFPADLTGLTGTQDEIKSAADAFFVDYSKIDMPGSLAEYTMDHTSILYLMDENWKLKTFFTGIESSPQYIADCLIQLSTTGQ